MQFVKQCGIKCKGVNKQLYSIGTKKVGEISKEGACVVRENGSHKLMLQLKFWQQFRIQAPDHFSWKKCQTFFARKILFFSRTPLTFGDFVRV